MSCSAENIQGREARMQGKVTFAPWRVPPFKHGVGHRVPRTKAWGAAKTQAGLTWLKTSQHEIGSETRAEREYTFCVERVL